MMAMHVASVLLFMKKEKKLAGQYSLFLILGLMAVSLGLIGILAINKEDKKEEEHMVDKEGMILE